MLSKTSRIAYLKRVLKRLDDEELRIQQLVSTGALSLEGGSLTTRLVKKSREALLLELYQLEARISDQTGSPET